MRVVAVIFRNHKLPSTGRIDSKLGRHVATLCAFLDFAHGALNPVLDQGSPLFALRRPGPRRRKVPTRQGAGHTNGFGYDVQASLSREERRSRFLEEISYNEPCRYGKDFK